MSITDLSLRLKEIKFRYDLTNEELGKICGVSYNAIFKILNGTTKDPGISIITNLCRHFKINPSWLLLGEGEMFEEDNTKKNLQSGKDNFREEFFSTLLKTKDDYIRTLEDMVSYLKTQNLPLKIK